MGQAGYAHAPKRDIRFGSGEDIDLRELERSVSSTP
jgi:hypothetical protein